MSSFHIRPRLKHLVSGVQSEVEATIKEHLLKNPSQFTVTHLPGNIYIKINPKRIHFWSPQLHLSFEQEEDQVIIRGLYGPNPTVWAIFFFGYVALGILALFAAMWGFTQWSLGVDASILWLLPILAAIGLILYFSAQAGQKMGAQQMFEIHHAFEEVSGDHIKVL